MGAHICLNDRATRGRTPGHPSDVFTDRLRIAQSLDVNMRVGAVFRLDDDGVRRKTDARQKTCRILIRVQDNIIEIGSGFPVNIYFMILNSVIEQYNLRTRGQKGTSGSGPNDPSLPMPIG